MKTPPPSDLDTDLTGTDNEDSDSRVSSISSRYSSSIAPSTSIQNASSRASKIEEFGASHRSDSPFKKEQTPRSEGSSSTTSLTASVRKEGQRATKRAAARSKKVSEQIARLPLLLCLAYERLHRWQKIDTLIHEALQAFGPTNSRGMPILLNLEVEDRWVRLMVRRGVACAFLGEEHFERGSKYFSLALRVQPRCRQASTGAHIMDFLKAQLLSG